MTVAAATPPVLQAKVAVLHRAHDGPQSALLACPVSDVFYGGARGGGKSYGLILDFCAHAQRWGAHARGILFRRSYPELEEIEVLCSEILKPLGWRWAATKRTWFAPNGAWLRLRYLDKDEDADLYQGHAYTWMGFDEAGNWPSPVPLDKLWACLRSAHGVPVCRRLTGNPGGPGHNWLKARYIDPAAPFKVHDLTFKVGERKIIIQAVFIPAKLEDNPTLMKNDPGYEDRLVAAAGGAMWLVKAWRLGLWDIIAGGMFDDVWKREIHVLEPFNIPESWRIDRSFDWGSARPFSVGWWAAPDGTDAEEQPHKFPRGSLIRIAEWYGWTGTPNEGMRMDSAEIARGIVQREAEMGLTGRVRKGPADPSIFTKEDGPSIADNMKTATRGAVQWSEGNNKPGSRKNRWQRMRTMLRAAMQRPREDPGLWVFDRCTDGFLRTVPVAQRDKTKVDDIDTDSEDHVCDEAGYRCMEVRGRWRVGKVVHAS